jgi:acyl carrier protein
MPFDQNDTYARVGAIIADQLNIQPNSITSQSSLEDLGADSLDRAEITIKLEEEFGIEINDKVAEKLTNIGQVVEYVHNLRSDK